MLKGAKELEVSGILKSLHNRKRFGNPPRFRSAHLSKDLVQRLELNVVDSFQRLFVTNFWNGNSYDFCFRHQIVDSTSFVFSLNKIFHVAFFAHGCIYVYNLFKCVLPKFNKTQDSICFNAAISSCEKDGQWEQALGLFRQMEAAHCLPDLITYSSAISAFEKGRIWQKGRSLM